MNTMLGEILVFFEHNDSTVEPSLTVCPDHVTAFALLLRSEGWYEDENCPVSHDFQKDATVDVDVSGDGVYFTPFVVCTQTSWKTVFNGQSICTFMIV